MILIIASAIIVSIVVILIGFVLFGIIYKPKPTEIFVDPREGELGKFCTREPVKCSTVADCDKICNETGTIELECVPVDRYNAEQVKLFGPTGAYCLPKKPPQHCSAEHGGVWAWSGYAAVDNMEWDCLCTYPGYYGDEGCKNLNAGICSEDQDDFKWDATAKGAGPPGATDCTCPEGTYKMISQEGQVPKCIPNNIFPNYYKSNMRYPLTCTSASDCPPNHTCDSGECKFSTIHGISVQNIAPPKSNYSALFMGIGDTKYFVGKPDQKPPTTPIYVGESFGSGAGATPVAKLINYVSVLDNYVAVTLYPNQGAPPACSLWVKLGQTVQADFSTSTVYLKNPDGTRTKVVC